MLLKNFGVSRHRRVVFYDYDEIRSVGECRFREWPQAQTYDEQIASEPWFHVAPEDVFPERFPMFMGLPGPLAAALKTVHGQLFRPQWWWQLQAQLRSGEWPDTPPYPDALKLA